MIRFGLRIFRVLNDVQFCANIFVRLSLSSLVPARACEWFEQNLGYANTII